MTTLRWGRWRLPSLSVWWSRKKAENVDHGLALALGVRPGGLAGHVGGEGQLQALGDHVDVGGVERAAEVAATVEGLGQVHLGGGLLRGLGVVEHGIGLGGPVLHGRQRVEDVELGQAGHDGGFVFGEQEGAAVGDVGDDDLDLPARERAIFPGRRGDGQGSDSPGSAQDPVGLLVGHVQPGAHPGRHRRGAVELPTPVVIERSSGPGGLGAEAPVEVEQLDECVALSGNHQVLDRFGEVLKHEGSVHQFAT